MDDLEHFVDAQRDIYPQVRAELAAGAKRSHWMWFIFPQIAGLGRSAAARHYAISGLEEARAYLAHPLLGARLEQCTDLMLGWAGKRSAAAILGPVDVLKFRSSMTLFELAAFDPPARDAGASPGAKRFTHALDAFCLGRRDERTLHRLHIGDRAFPADGT